MGKKGSINVKTSKKADCRVFSLDGRNGADFTLCPKTWQNRSAAKPSCFVIFVKISRYMGLGLYYNRFKYLH